MNRAALFVRLSASLFIRVSVCYCCGLLQQSGLAWSPSSRPVVCHGKEQLLRRQLYKQEALLTPFHCPRPSPQEAKPRMHKSDFDSVPAQMHPRCADKHKYKLQKYNEAWFLFFSGLKPQNAKFHSKARASLVFRFSIKQLATGRSNAKKRGGFLSSVTFAA